MADEVDAKFIPDLSNTSKEKLIDVMSGEGDLETIIRKFGSVNNIIHDLHTSSTKGIIGIRDAVKYRQEKFGRNVIPLQPPKNILSYLLCAMRDWVILVLFIGALVSVILGALFPDKCEGRGTFVIAMYEGIGIMATVVVMILLTAFSDYLKETDFRSLHSKIDRERKMNVIRSGKMSEILSKDIVVGDLCQLSIGTLIPGDGIIMQQSGLVVNESALTGQTIMVPKETHSLVYAGSHVVEGGGKMIVMSVGCNTQLHMKRAQSPATPSLVTFKPAFPDQPEYDDEGNISFEHKEDTALLQGKINKIQIALGRISVVLALVAILVIIIRFSVYSFITLGLTFDPSYINEYIRALIIGIVVLIIAVPEALSLVISTSLAFCVRKMYHDQALVQHVDMLETMGNITNLCCNKTGVLTQNRMVVAKSYLGEQTHGGAPNQFTNNIPKALFTELCKAISINTSYLAQILEEGADNIPKQAGNRIDAALLQYLFELGEYYQTWRDDYPEDKLIKVFDFSPAKKCMTTVINDGEEGLKLYSKGDAEKLLELCTSVVGMSGEPKEFTKDDAENLSRDLIEPWKREGLRLLCLTTKMIPFADWQTLSERTEKDLLTDLTLQGIVGIEDPVRDQVPVAVWKCQKAGITVRMVTGDNVITARSVAIKCGILKPNDESLVYDGDEFNSYIRDPDRKINEDRFNAMWPKLSVLARAKPSDKFTLVKGMMQSHIKPAGEIVAVTGSGANDGPVLRMADVGFTMGVAGTAISKEASDVILLNDDFNSIVNAIKWGRHIYHTVLKYLQFQFTVSLVAVIVVVVGASIVGRSPLVATQLLWINIIMDTLACFALTRDIPTEDLLNYKPCGRHKPLISRTLLRNVIGHSIYQLIVMLLLILKGSELFDIADGFHTAMSCKPNQHSSIVFTTFVLMQLFNEINARMLQERNVFTGIHKNYVFLIIWVGQAGMQIIIVQFFYTAFHVAGMDWDQWMWCLFFGFSELLWAQLIFTIPKSVLPAGLRCVADGTPEGRGIAYIRSCSRMEQTDSGIKASMLSPLADLLLEPQFPLHEVREERLPFADGLSDIV
ncbi:plasma membrane calcium-transporting ATPase 3-like [Montipora capricornis]|uniref:plasma membrane calcium-transporting ATPase 3-like n=2 Tax=Montipora capricornis TaxID=246305 RepID=UPI0035F20906